MCDYSLEIYRSRPAVQGDIHAPPFSQRHHRLRRPDDCTTAVCMPAGARLRLEGLNEAVQHALNVGPAEAVEMICLPTGAIPIVATSASPTDTRCCCRATMSARLRPWRRVT